MVIPIADDNSSRRTTPGITYLLVAVNVLVFLAMVRATPTEQARLMATYAAVPRAVIPPLFVWPLLPAWLLIGGWVFLQFWSGLSSLGALAAGGVACWAHVGGFVLGAVLARPFSWAGGVEHRLAATRRYPQDLYRNDPYGQRPPRR